MSTDSLADDGTDDLSETTNADAAVSILSSGTPLRSLKKEHHPDAGGSEARFKQVVSAEKVMLDES